MRCGITEQEAGIQASAGVSLAGWSGLGTIRAGTNGQLQDCTHLPSTLFSRTLKQVYPQVLSGNRQGS